eukprot:5613657-Pleurochrysis_carterae.AAC.5
MSAHPHNPLSPGLAHQIQLSSPQKLKRVFSPSDRSSPRLEAGASARRQLPLNLLKDVRDGSARRESLGSPISAPSPRQKMEVWVPDANALWVKGWVQKQIGRSQLLVQTEDGAAVKVDLAHNGGEMLTVNPSIEADMTSLW